MTRDVQPNQLQSDQEYPRKEYGYESTCTDCCKPLTSGEEYYLYDDDEPRCLTCLEDAEGWAEVQAELRRGEDV